VKNLPPVRREMAPIAGVSVPPDLIGKTFGRLTVVAAAAKGARGRQRWRCRCSCGTSTIVRGDHLVAGLSVLAPYT